MRLYLAVGILTIASIGRHASCQEPQHDAETIGKFIFESHVAGRQKLKTGRFNASGTRVNASPQWNAFSGDVRIFCAFDFPNRSIRFDRTEVAQAGTTLGGQYVRREDVVVFRRYGNNIISIVRPTRSQPDWVRAFDVRAVGIAHQHDLDWGVPFEKLVEIYESQPVAEVVKESQTLYCLVWHVRDKERGLPSFRRRVWFDQEKGYWPVRFEMQVFAGFEPGKDVNGVEQVKWSETVQSQEIEVKKFRGLWVPTTITFTSDRGSKHESLELAWEMVNDIVEEESFTWEGFSQEGVDHVVDSRSGRPVVIE